MYEIRAATLIIGLALAVLVGSIAIVGRRHGRNVTGCIAVLCLIAAVGALISLAAPFSYTTPHVLLATPPPVRPAPVPLATTVYVAGWSCHELDSAPQGCDQSQSLVALSGRDGAVRWKVPAPGQLGSIATGPLLYNGVIYAYSQDDSMGHGELTAMRGSDGKTLWRVPFPHYAEMMEGMGDTLYVLIGNPDVQNLTFGWIVVTLNVQNGSTLRTVPLPTEVENTTHLALDGDLLYTCDVGGGVKAIQMNDGALLWHSTYGQSAASADACIVVTTAGVVYVSPAHGGGLFALRAGDGALLWQMHGDSLHEIAAAANGVVYVIQPGSEKFGSSCNPDCPILSTTPDTLFAIHTSNGKLLWQRQFAFGSVRGGALAGEALYLGGGALTALRTSDGRTLWQVTQKGGTYLVRGALAGVVFVELLGPSVTLHSGTAYGFPMAVDARDGSPFWQGTVWLDVSNEMVVEQ